MEEEITTLEGAIVTTSETVNGISHETSYYFDIVSEHSIQMQNQITDNYLENNTAVQDHIAQSPITITLRGISGEKVYTPADARADELAAMQTALKYSNVQNFFTKLSALSVLYPSVSNSTQMAMNAYNYALSSVNRYLGIAGKFINKNNPLDAASANPIQQDIETRLQEIYRKFSVIRANNTSLIVQTPYAIFQDMYIQSLTLRQSNQNFVTDIELTLKQLRFANVEVTGVNEEVRARYNAYQRALLENNGKAQGEYTIIGGMLYKLGVNNYKIYSK